MSYQDKYIKYKKKYNNLKMHNLYVFNLKVMVNL